MSKRKRGDEEDDPRLLKRARGVTDRLSSFSDELVLRVLLHLSVEEIAKCHRVSKRLQDIAGDSQVWRAAYHKRFVLPRLEARASSAYRSAASIRSSWLDERILLNTCTDWKRQYKVRHNWAKGSCNVSKIPIASPSPPPLLARLHAGVVITVDQTSGLSAWVYQGSRKRLAQYVLPVAAGKPVCLTLDTSGKSSDRLRIAIGLDSGACQVYAFERSKNTIQFVCEVSAAPQDSIGSIAIDSPYLVTLTTTSLLSLYHLSEAASSADSKEPPQLLSRVRSSTAWSPLSLSLRIRSDVVLASIAYALPSIHTGWSVGIQELAISNTGEVIDSRLASSCSAGFTPLVNARRTSTSSVPRSNMPLHLSTPTSLSYTHPYLLVTHKDNTLTLFVANSTSDTLTIGSGKRLWGHTSSVSDVQIGGRGKAVSVSSRGSEIRVWELERATPARRRAKHHVEEQISIPIAPKDDLSELKIHPPNSIKNLVPADRGCSQAARLGSTSDESSRSWVSFDDENVVVMREETAGTHALTVYDFT